jgi:predicted RND superfamily exporter protein/2-polyprenyl-3-methyl-5-hydroxy-6-metoxy-1,4-benzoquinol methylase
MSNPFVLLYKLFESRKSLFYVFLFLLVTFIVLFASKLSLKEDISAFIPKEEKTRKYQEVIKNLKINDRLIVNVFFKDSTILNPDLLTEYADILVDSLRSRYDSTWLKEIRYKIEDETALNVFDLLYNDLPYYLDKDDYQKIEKKLTDSAVYNKLKTNYETILSTEGTALKNFIIKDPLGLNNSALSKLARLQSDENFELYNGYFLTKNRKNLFLYISVAYPPNDSDKNTVLVNGLSEIISTLDTSGYKTVKAEYFGSPAIAASNVKQIKNDSLFTTLAALTVIFAGLILYFRNIKMIFLIFFPVIFGLGFSLALIYLFRQEISAIAIGAGSIVMGIAMDYSLHFFTHLKHERSVKKVISDLTIPLTLGCTTTVGAFLCLNYMQSEALQDMGIFAALTLAGAAFCCLIILPQLSKSFEKKDIVIREHKILDKLTSYAFHKNKVLLFIIVLLTIVFAFNYDKVGFETDMTKLGNIPPELQQAENNLDKISSYKLKSVFLISQGTTLEKALDINASVLPSVQKLVRENKIKKFSNIGEFLLTDAAKQEKINSWKTFWTPERINLLQTRLYKYGSEFHFKETAFDNTLSLLRKGFNYQNDSSSKELKKLFLEEYINETDQGTSIITILKVEQEDKSIVYKAFEKFDNVFVLDRGSMVTMFAKILNEDFNLILILCSVLVFGFLLLSYGRIELAFLTFLPMIISWIWILGIMGLSGIKFNIINIIICTFIFGLGDDYSIFTLDGLEQEYKYGRNVLSSYRNSIFLSAFTTIVGIGVLIFAKHPALKSIALVTIIGISSIVFVSLVVQPFLYELFVLGRKKKGKLPITIYSLLFAFILLWYFIKGAVLIRFLSIFSSEKKMSNLSLKFIASLSAFVLYTERKFGEDLAVEFVKKYIGLIPNAIAGAFENSYSEKRKLITNTDYFRGKLIKNYIFKGPVVEWYTRIKTGLEDNYKVFDELVPTKGHIVDIGCGYGYLSYMLSLTSPEREITGIDYDEEKIEIAGNGVLRTSRLNFFHSDVLEYKYEKSDVFIISDVLHYLKEESQTILIQKCLDNLNEGGMLIIRDGNSELEERHKGTKLTEFFSTKVVGFNKVTIDKLCFTSKEKILSIVSGYPVTVEILDTTQFTSNIIFIIRRNK